MEKINQGQDDGVDDRNFENKNPMTSVLNGNADKKMISNHVISKDSKDQNALKRKLEEIDASVTEVDDNSATPATNDDDKEKKMSAAATQFFNNPIEGEEETASDSTGTTKKVQNCRNNSSVAAAADTTTTTPAASGSKATNLVVTAAVASSANPKKKYRKQCPQNLVNATKVNATKVERSWLKLLQHRPNRHDKEQMKTWMECVLLTSEITAPETYSPSSSSSSSDNDTDDEAQRAGGSQKKSAPASGSTIGDAGTTTAESQTYSTDSIVSDAMGCLEPFHNMMAVATTGAMISNADATSSLEKSGSSSNEATATSSNNGSSKCSNNSNESSTSSHRNSSGEEDED